MIVQQILTNAIFKSVQDRALQPIVLPHYKDVALDCFNDILEEWKDLVPYQSQVTFNNIENLLATKFIQIDSIVYVLNHTTFQLRPVSITEFQRQKSPDNLIGFPTIYYFDSLTQNIDVYPKPSNSTYSFVVNGRIAIVNLGEFDKVPINMTGTMKSALTNETAFRVAAEYGAPWDAKKETIRLDSLNHLKEQRNVDLEPYPTCDFGIPGMSNSSPFPTWYYMSGGV